MNPELFRDAFRSFSIDLDVQAYLGWWVTLKSVFICSVNASEAMFSVFDGCLANFSPIVFLVQGRPPQNRTVRKDPMNCAAVYIHRTISRTTFRKCRKQCWLSEFTLLCLVSNWTWMKAILFSVQRGIWNSSIFVLVVNSFRSVLVRLVPSSHLAQRPKAYLKRSTATHILVLSSFFWDFIHDY